ncbi:MAG: hypothetical protein QOG44_2779, partial [Acidimicrobiaceae bacterium]|nr:hypothetical protein [Acidimicrobiaceae bacterium]
NVAPYRSWPGSTRTDPGGWAAGPDNNDASPHTRAGGDTGKPDVAVEAFVASWADAARAARALSDAAAAVPIAPPPAKAVKRLVAA